MSKVLQLALIASVLVLVSLAVLFHEVIIHEPSTAVSGLFLALSVGYAIFSTSQVRAAATEESRIGSAGLLATVSLVVFAASFQALRSSINGSDRSAYTFCIVALGLFIAGQYLNSFNRAHLDKVSEIRNRRSAHGNWSVQLHHLVGQCHDDEERRVLQALCERCRYLSRSVSTTAAKEEASIEAAISQLAQAVSRRDASAVVAQCNEVDRLFDCRETVMKSLHSRI